jgi:hypothetical protein
MEEIIKKKRGRKPKNFYSPVENLVPVEEVEKKKRGRKKKYEIENSEKILNRDQLNNFNHNVAYSDDEEPINTEDTVKKISFGNLNITVSKKNIVSDTENNYRNDIINKVNKTVIDENEYSDEEETEIPIENILNLNQENFEKYYKEKKKYSTNEPTKEHSMKRIRVITTLKNHIKEEDWPSKCDVCCWWCCHKFDTAPCTMPVSYDPLRKRYKFVGIFCSWNCTKAYNFDKTDRKMTQRSELISFLVKQLYSLETAISFKPAPFRQCLKMFGGYMSIDEFRNSSLSVDSYSMNLIKYNYIYPEITELTNVKSNKQEKKNLRLARS